MSRCNFNKFQISINRLFFLLLVFYTQIFVLTNFMLNNLMTHFLANSLNFNTCTNFRTRSETSRGETKTPAIPKIKFFRRSLVIDND